MVARDCGMSGEGHMRSGAGRGKEGRWWEVEGREVVGDGVAVQRLAGGDDHVLTMASTGSAETC